MAGFKASENEMGEKKRGGEEGREKFLFSNTKASTLKSS